MSRLLTLALPLPWADLGFPEPLGATPTSHVTRPDPAWAWEGSTPPLGIPTCGPAPAPSRSKWSTDHVVVLVPDLATALERFATVGLVPRLRVVVRGRPTAFLRAGTVIEAVEAPVRRPAIFGVALATEEPLETVATRWRARGFDVTDPGPALQPGRRILTVRGLRAGLAVMSPDRAVTTIPAHEP